MFGALGKLIGGIVAIIGLVAMVVAPFLVTMGAEDQASNEEGGLFEDNERTQENGQMVLAGAAAGAAGVIVAALGLMIVGISAASSNALRERRTRQAQQTVIEMEGS